MSDLNLKALQPKAAEKVLPFLKDILTGHAPLIHSIHVTGTSLTADYDERLSDINSVVVLKRMDLTFLETLAPLGKKYGKQKIAAPLIMTPEYIASSLDVFPIEFLNFKLVHTTVSGEDMLAALEIDQKDLRLQCERDIKSKLIWLRQGYLASQGDRKTLTEGFIRSIAGYIPLFRGIISLLDRQPPLLHHDVITALSEATGLNTDVFSRILKEKHEKARFSTRELNTLFEDYYEATERLRKMVDDHSF